MRLTYVRLFIFILLFGCATSYALRISRPALFTLPWTESKIEELNNTLYDILDNLEGRYELDIVTTQKTNARNGEFWILQTGPTSTIQWKANNQIYGITP